MTDQIKDVSIEQFAAFLDGNLPEDEMAAMEVAIDGSERLSGILDDAMDIEDYMDLQPQSAFELPEEIASMDFELPVIEDPNGDEWVLATYEDDEVEVAAVAAAADEPEVITEVEVVEPPADEPGTEVVDEMPAETEVTPGYGEMEDLDETTFDAE